MSSIRNKDMTKKRVQYAQKIAPRILIKFTLFIVSLLLRRHKACTFRQFFKCNFLGPKRALQPHFFNS